jgi:hypothetical protein
MDNIQGNQQPLVNAVSQSANDGVYPSKEHGARNGGPRTQSGKKRSSMNSTKHGIFAQVALSKTEARKFNSLLRDLRAHFNPAGKLENLLVEKIGVIIWRYRRLLSADRQSVESWNRGASLADLVVPPPPTDLLLRYETMLERAFDRALSQLERLQQKRLGAPATPRIEIDFND